MEVKKESAICGFKRMHHPFPRTIQREPERRHLPSLRRKRRRNEAGNLSYFSLERLD